MLSDIEVGTTDGVQDNVQVKVTKFQKINCLTLIGIRGETFYSLSILDQIFSAVFLSKIFKLFWG